MKKKKKDFRQYLASLLGQSRIFETSISFFDFGVDDFVDIARNKVAR